MRNIDHVGSDGSGHGIQFGGFAAGEILQFVYRAHALLRLE
jgi:hypothetical protein